jgi:CDP-paratose synthetase
MSNIGPDPEIFLAKLLANDTLAMTPGEQVRDFIHVGDVVGAYLTILQSGEVLPPGPTVMQAGTGTAHSVRTRALCGLTSRLDFGVHLHRSRGIIYSAADTAVLKVLDWAPPHTLAPDIRASLVAMLPRHLSSAAADNHARLPR